MTSSMVASPPASPAPAPVASLDVAVVLVIRDAAPLALRTLVTLARTTADHDFHTVLVDDASTDATPTLVAGVQGDFTALRSPEPAGFAACADRAVAACEQPIVVLLREDLVPTPGWLSAAVAPFADPAVAAVRPRVLDLAGQEVDDMSWPCLAIRRSAYDATGGIAASARAARPVKACFAEALADVAICVSAPDSLLLSVPLAASDAAAVLEL